MKEITEFYGHKVFYEKKAHLKHLYIRISHEGDIVIKSSSLSSSRCQKVLKEKEGWILKQLAKIKERPEHSLGESIRLFGSIRHLREDSALLTLAERIDRLAEADEEKVRGCYFAFYKEVSMGYIPKRVKHFCALMKLYPSEVKFRRMKRRWGSCNSRGIITFNTLAMQLSKEQIDYVVVHELAHLKYMNHSAEFYALVKKTLPNAKSIHLETKSEAISY